jgi:hypothetical protein
MAQPISPVAIIIVKGLIITAYEIIMEVKETKCKQTALEL